MTLVRTHFIIDMIAGLIFAHYFHHHAEWVVYYIDCKLLKVLKKGRGRLFWEACEACGWGNAKLSDYTTKEDLLRT